MAARKFTKLYPHDHIMKAVVLPFVPEVMRPNHFTIARMMLTPFVLWLLFVEEYMLGVPLFVLTAFTDVIDGSLARVRKQITPWGIFFDPIADKLLIGSVALLIALQYFHPIIVFVAIALDLLPAIVFLSRLHPDGSIMMANVWGKVKMFLQFSSIALLLLGITLNLTGLIDVAEIVLVVSLFFGLVAAVTYSL